MASEFTFAAHQGRTCPGIRNRRAVGFTLIELLVVITIIGILLGISIPAVLDKGDDARLTKARTQLAKKVPAAIGAYLRANMAIQGSDESDMTADLLEFGAPVETSFNERITYSAEYDVRNPRPGVRTQRQIQVNYPIPGRLLNTDEIQNLLAYVGGPSQGAMIAKAETFSSASFSGVRVFYNTQ